MTRQHAAAAALLFATLLGACARAPARPSLLLITIDTLRADRLGCYGNPDRATPTLDALARDGARFPEAYAAAPITAPSHATLLTGTYPLRHGVRTNGTYLLRGPDSTLAEVLQKRGYRTAAFVGAVPLDHVFGFGRGFDTYDDDFSRSVLRGRDLSPWYQVSILARERRADEVVGPAIAWLERQPPGEPFFLWVHLFDPHSPYAAPVPADRRFYSGGDPYAKDNRSLDDLWRAPQSWHDWLRGVTDAAYVRALYQGEVAYADSQVGALLGALDRLGRRNDSVVVATADHGEALGEHGEWFFHGDLVFDTTLRVPLLIRAPWRVDRGTVASVRARGVDLFPTALDLLGLPIPAGLDGETLLPPLLRGTSEPRPVLAEAAYRDRSGRGVFAYIEGRRKLIVSDATSDRPALSGCYDLSLDPLETHSLCRTQADDFADLRARLDALRRSLPRGSGPVAGEVPPEVLEALSSLGYQNQ